MCYSKNAGCLKVTFIFREHLVGWGREREDLAMAGILVQRWFAVRVPFTK